nr:MAG TPA: hypothetical protein [Caudoviricetes sp.]DAW90748.1 MAG TPA: hypothetical protein [Bacteriophage sp.]
MAGAMRRVGLGEILEEVNKLCRAKCPRRAAMNRSA